MNDWMIVGNQAHFLPSLIMGSTQRQRWWDPSCICAKIGERGEETPDNNQTGPVQAWAHRMVGPGLARGEGHADSHSGGPKKLRHGPDNLKSRKNINGRMTMYLEVIEILSAHLISDCCVARIRLEFCGKDWTETGTMELFICDLWDLQ